MFPRDVCTQLAGRAASDSNISAHVRHVTTQPLLSRLALHSFFFFFSQTWELTEMATPEKPRHMGRYWCWVFWEFKVDVLRYCCSIFPPVHATKVRHTALGHLFMARVAIWRCALGATMVAWALYVRSTDVVGTAV